MIVQISLAYFFKLNSGASLLSNPFSAILNNSDLDVTEIGSKPPLKTVKQTTKILKYDES